jgi:hypothetical protein
VLEVGCGTGKAAVLLTARGSPVLSMEVDGQMGEAPVEVYNELTAERARSVAQAAASIRAEGLVAEAGVEAIAERWARGEISTSQMRDLVRQLYGVA